MKNRSANWIGYVVVGLIVGLVLLVLFKGGSGRPAETALAGMVGRPAPQFQLRDASGNLVSNADLKGKKTVLFFNEGIICYPACWNQVLQLGKDERFRAGDLQAFSVVTDSPSDWQKAAAQMPGLAEARLLFDRDKSASNAFGALTAGSSMHFGSLPGHTYFILDRDGIVRYVYDDPRMAVNNDLLIQEMQKLP